MPRMWQLRVEHQRIPRMQFVRIIVNIVKYFPGEAINKLGSFCASGLALRCCRQV